MHRPSRENKSYSFKVILIGHSAVGKTAILRRYIEDEFDEKYICTIGVQFKAKNLIVNDDQKIDLKIWDTTGDEKYKAITKQYYRDAKGILLVYDITNRYSFECCSEWLSDIKDTAPKDTVIVLVGNKEDLVSERQVTKMEGKNFAKSNNLHYFTEGSAKTGKGIPMAFQKMGEKMAEIHKEKCMEEDREIEIEKKKAKPTIDIKDTPIKNEQSKKCC